MILLFIIISILYLLLMTFMLSLYYTNRKDKEEIENRILQLEKRIQDYKKEYNDYCKINNTVIHSINEIINKQYLDLQKQIKKNSKEKEVLEMACKKGRGGRKK